MPSLKALRMRINSVKSTQKITSAMKMVAASKLRRAQQQAEAARPYALRMQRMLNTLAASVADQPNAPMMLAGTGKDQVHLLIAVTADRGLAGAFNSSIGRADPPEGTRFGGTGQDGQNPRGGPQGTRLSAPGTRQPDRRRRFLRGKRRIDYTDAQRTGRTHHRDVERRASSTSRP